MVKPGRKRRKSSTFVGKDNNLFYLNTLTCILKTCTVNSKILEVEDRDPSNLTVDERCGVLGNFVQPEYDNSL